MKRYVIVIEVDEDTLIETDKEYEEEEIYDADTESRISREFCWMVSSGIKLIEIKHEI